MTDKEKVLTPITDRAARKRGPVTFGNENTTPQDFVPIETARELEAIAEEQHQALRACAAVCAGETMSKSGLVSALELAQKSFARYQQLKEKAK